MAFVKRTWIARDVQYPGRIILTPTGNTNENDVTRSEGTVNAEGDIISAENLNDQENRIEAGFEDAAAATAPDSLKLGGIVAPIIIDGSGNAQNALKLGGNPSSLYPTMSSDVWNPHYYAGTTEYTVATAVSSFVKTGKKVLITLATSEGDPILDSGAITIGGLPYVPTLNGTGSAFFLNANKPILARAEGTKIYFHVNGGSDATKTDIIDFNYMRLTMEYEVE